MHKIEKSVLFTIVNYRCIVYYITVTPYIQTTEKYFTESGNPKKDKQLGHQISPFWELLCESYSYNRSS